MLSRDCDGCSQSKACSNRYGKVGIGENVYCPDGTAHLVDDGTEFQIVAWHKRSVEQIR